jgi:cytochrome c oxidase accessory protein FixG
VDCGLCVQVCPTGIDIRKGLQYECIGCGACADVCDTVMDKFGFEKGLVKYSTQNAMKNKWDKATMVRRVFRPRVVVYTGILLFITIAMMVSLATKHSYKVDVVRDRGVLARIVEGGNIENVYSLQVMNATEKTQKYDFSVAGLNNIKIAGESHLVVNPAEARWIAVRVRIPYDTAAPGSHPIEFKIKNSETNEIVLEKSVFIIPR